MQRGGNGRPAPHGKADVGGDPFPALAMPPIASSMIRSLLLFCGSSPGRDPAHAADAEALGRLLASRGVTLVYGGGALGLMGIVARAAMTAGGRVEGVIPRFLVEREVAQDGLDEMVVVETLHARKAVMFERADAVLALPGGPGTLDELIELLTWRHLGLHAKPIWLLGANGYWQPLLALLDHVIAQGFAPSGIGGMVEPLPGLDALAERLARPSADP